MIQTKKVKPSSWWLFQVAIPFFAVLFVDIISKSWVRKTLPMNIDFGLIRLLFTENRGLAAGLIPTDNALALRLIPTMFGGYLVYMLVILQYFLPLKFKLTRTCLTILFAGWIANALDRAVYGSVADFIVFNLPLMGNYAFNLADLFQGFSFVIILGTFVLTGNQLIPAVERRGRLIVDWNFQWRYCVLFLLSGISLATALTAIGYTLLQASLTDSLVLSSTHETWSHLFVLCYGMTSLVFLFTFFLMGLIYSKRIVSPIQKFMTMLDDLMAGKSGHFTLRETDNFREMESLAKKYQEFFATHFQVNLPSLEENSLVPELNTVALSGLHLTRDMLLGKKAWIIFYRYAECPLCALHLSSVKGLINDSAAKGIRVIVVYDGGVERLDTKGPPFNSLLSNLKAEIVTDLDGEIYRRFRTRASIFGLFSLRVLWNLLVAQLKGYTQGRIHGRKAQLPAHFLVSADGRIHAVHYGVHISDHIARDKVEKFIRES